MDDVVSKDTKVWGSDTIGFRVAHIFPLNENDTVSLSSHFLCLHCSYSVQEESFELQAIYHRCAHPGEEINSVQQGFLYSTEMHEIVKDYAIGIDPDVRTYSSIGHSPLSIFSS